MSPAPTSSSGYLSLLKELNAYNAFLFMSVLIGVTTFYVSCYLLYNIYLHPLSRYPGPKLAASTRLWHIFQKARGQYIYAAQSAHEKYGSIVRIAPDELSYADPTAWNQIYGHRSGKPELQKDPVFYKSTSAGMGGIIGADRARHSVMRRQLSHGFSERAMRNQDGIIRGYADLCIQRLNENCGGGANAIDMVQWLNFFTFDVMGDLVFGQPFGCLNSSTYHTWVSMLFDAVKVGSFMRAVTHFPILVYALPLFMPKDLPQRRADHHAMSTAKAEYRKAQGSEKPDLISGFLKPESDVTMQEYVTTSQTMIVAGSETTATLMSGATYLLLSNPEKMKRVVSEIRSSFNSSDEIDLISVNRLEYLLACLNESLRMYPPVPDSLPRRTGDDTEIICGRPVPPHTTVGVHQWATYRDPDNFSRPNDFIPERWLDDPAFASDKKHALQPFSTGPRNCIGRNLAYFEMRLMMTLLLWNFDIELLPVSKNWSEQKAYVLWEKVPLMVKLTPRSV